MHHRSVVGCGYHWVSVTSSGVLAGLSERAFDSESPSYTSCLALSPAGELATSGPAQHGDLVIFDVQQHRVLSRLPLVSEHYLGGLRFSPNGETLFVVEEEGQAGILTAWDIRQETPVLRFRTRGLESLAGVCLLDGAPVVAGEYALKRIDPSTGAVTAETRSSRFILDLAKVGPEVIATRGPAPGGLDLWRVTGQNVAFERRVWSQEIAGRITGGENYIVTEGDRYFEIWDCSSTEPIGRVSRDTLGCQRTSAKFSPVRGHRFCVAAPGLLSIVHCRTMQIEQHELPAVYVDSCDFRPL